MNTLFLIGMISWIIHILATDIKIGSFNSLKPYLKDLSQAPTWYHVVVWAEQLSSISYWIVTIVIFLSFQSPLFMVTSAIAIAIYFSLTKRGGKNKTLTKPTAEEIDNLKMEPKNIRSLVWASLLVFLLGSLPYLALLFTLI